MCWWIEYGCKIQAPKDLPTPSTKIIPFKKKCKKKIPAFNAILLLLPSRKVWLAPSLLEFAKNENILKFLRRRPPKFKRRSLFFFWELCHI